MIIKMHFGVDMTDMMVLIQMSDGENDELNEVKKDGSSEIMLSVMNSERRMLRVRVWLSSRARSAER